LIALSDAQWGLIVTACTASVAVIAQLIQANSSHRHDRELRALEMAHERNLSLGQLNRERKEALYVDVISRMLQWQDSVVNAGDLPALRDASAVITTDPIDSGLKARVTAFSPAKVHTAMRTWDSAQDQWRATVRAAVNGDADWSKVERGRTAVLTANRDFVAALSVDLGD
jgi:hypothetical protein